MKFLEKLIVFLQGFSMLVAACAPYFSQKYHLGGYFLLPDSLRIVGIVGLFISSIFIAGGGIKLGKYARILPEPADRATLKTDGFYSFVRHPMYTGFLLAAYSFILVWMSYVALLASVVLTFILLYKISLEEKYLEKKFGDSYLEYKKKVPMLLPLKFKK